MKFMAMYESTQGSLKWSSNVQDWYCRDGDKILCNNNSTHGFQVFSIHFLKRNRVLPEIPLTFKFLHSYRFLPEFLVALVLTEFCHLLTNFPSQLRKDKDP